MFKLINKKSGLTLVEVIVAAMLFALSTAGLFATITAISRPAGESTREVKAVMLGKQILEGLRNKVDATIWNDSSEELHPDGGDGTGKYELPNFYTDEQGIQYNAVYIVEDDPDINARKVTLNIIWDE